MGKSAYFRELNSHSLLELLLWNFEEYKCRIIVHTLDFIASKKEGCRLSNCNEKFCTACNLHLIMLKTMYTLGLLEKYPVV